MGDILPTVPDESLRIVFAIGSAGLGNYRRCISVLKAAMQSGAEVRILAGEPAAHLLRLELGPELFRPWDSFRFPAGPDLMMGRTGALIPSYGLAGLRNARTARKLFRDFRPHWLVTDSDYVAPLVARAQGIPVIAINHAVQSVREWSRTSRTERKGLRASMVLLERAEDLFFRRVAERILVPAIGFDDDEDERPDPPYRLVRPFFGDPRAMSPRPFLEAPSRLLVLAGGTGLGDFSFLEAAGPHFRGWSSRQAIGLVPSASKLDWLARLGIVPDPIPHVDRADLLVVQAGHSTLCDLLHWGRPAILLPIPGHAEQAMNAQIAERMGIARTWRGQGDPITFLEEFLTELPARTLAIREKRAQYASRPEAWDVIAESGARGRVS